MNNPDYDRIAVLRARLNHARGPDRELGYEIVVALLPGTSEAQKASELLQRGDIDTSAEAAELDLTTSVDAILRFLERRELTAHWNLSCSGTRKGEEPDPAGPYTANLSRGIFSHHGNGWTVANCLFDMAVQAICAGADTHGEEETILLFATQDREATGPIFCWSDSLKEQTREAVAKFWPHIEMWGKLPLKHFDGRFATIESYELHRGVLRVVDRRTKMFFDYKSIDTLIEAGWAVD